MRNAKMLLLITAILLAVGPRAGAAQRLLNTRFQGWVVSAWGGGAAFTDLQRATVPGAQQAGSQVQRLMADASPSIGASVAYWPNTFWGVRLQSGVAFTRYSLLVPPAGSGEVAESGGPELRVWSHDANVLFRAPFTPGDRVVPYGMVGGGILHYQDGGESAVGPFRPARSEVRPAIVLGLGAIVPLEQGGTGLTFELQDHIARTPIAAPHGGEPADGHVRWANYFRLTVGISVLGL